MAVATLGERLALTGPFFGGQTGSDVDRCAVYLRLGVLEVSVTAEAVASPVSCNNEVVSVPDSGRIDRVQRTLIVKVGQQMGGSPDEGCCVPQTCVLSCSG